MDIKNLELTENDFKLLVDGLDSLPEKGAVVDLVGAMLEGMLGDKNPETQEKFKRDQEAKRRAGEKAKETMREEIKILQGKLLMFKRYLIQIDALKQVEDIIR
jgi:hypothetical protein